MGDYLVRDVHLDVCDFVCEHVSTTTTENSSRWNLPRGIRCQISPTQRPLLHAETGGQPGGPAMCGALQAVVRKTVVVEREREDSSRVELAVW